MNFITQHPYVLLSAIAWLYVLLAIRWNNFKRLWYWSIVGGLGLWAAGYWIVTTGLFHFEIKPLLPILGIPSFFVLWGAGSGIIFAHYFKHTLLNRVLCVVVFSVLVFLAESWVEFIGRVQHGPGFTQWHELSLNLVMLSTLGLFVATIKERKVR